MRALIFDPFAGASGDMILGGLLDLGLSESFLRELIASLDLGDIDVTIEKTMRRGIAATRVVFGTPAETRHRHLRHILEVIDATNASARSRARASDAFHRIAEAEAAVHGTTVEKVHFHEVGAVDAILDVLCAMVAVDELGFERFYTRPVAAGSGWIEIAHGRYPVPAPATLRILEGIPLTGFELVGECTTPTGAAIIATLTGGQGVPDGLVARRTGFGAGTRDPADRPNCLRLVAADVADEIADRLFMLQTDVDDLPAEYAPAAIDAMMAAGALDAFVSSIGMKKGRPGFRFEALVTPAALDAVVDAAFRATTTAGVRYWPVTRPALARSEEVIEWRGQRIRRKRITLPGGAQRVKPE
jgi:uncharacterized protein (TIGR00299 family) protein